MNTTSSYIFFGIAIIALLFFLYKKIFRRKKEAPILEVLPEIREVKPKQKRKKYVKKPKPVEVAVDITYNDAEKTLTISIKNMDRLNLLITNLRGRRIMNGPIHSNVIDISSFGPDIYTADLYRDDVKLKSLRFTKN